MPVFNHIKSKGTDAKSQSGLIYDYFRIFLEVCDTVMPATNKIL